MYELLRRTLTGDIEIRQRARPGLWPPAPIRASSRTQCSTL